MFFHNSQTTLSGVPDDRHTPALLDMSTVREHNRQLFTYVDLPAHQASAVLGVDALLINQTSLIFKRFNPDNLMHALHDDLLPLYHTLLAHRATTGPGGGDGNQAFDVQLVMMEGSAPGGPYMHLYQLLTHYKPLLLHDIHQGSKPLCFREAYVGISKATTWYQYGFHQPQGPIAETTVTALELRQFTDFVRMRLGIDGVAAEADRGAPVSSHTTVLFTRKFNRLILNELELTMSLAQELQMKVVTLSIENHSLEHIISVLSHAAILIGMHGSLLSLAMFLPPGALLIELFPYAVNPNHYTPYKRLAQLRGMGILYKAWRNTDLAKSVAHPDNPWDTGGIAHLPDDEQRRILSSREVPLHLCCRDPEWLFRIYQDTIVDVPSVIGLIQTLALERDVQLGSATEESHALVCDNISPGWVRNITCRGSGTDVASSKSRSQHADTTSSSPPDPPPTPRISVRWEPPWNLDYLDPAETVQYEIWLQEAGKPDYSAWMMGKTEHVFDSGLTRGAVYNVWIRCVLDEDVVGPFNTELVLCNT